MPMTLHAHQRDASLHAGCGVRRWSLAMLVACLLLPCAAFAQDAKQDAATPREPVVQSPHPSPLRGTCKARLQRARRRPQALAVAVAATG
ncbi:MAG: hypothetical protein EOP93_19910, partial [Lysobacteraceae bacterium]